MIPKKYYYPNALVGKEKPKNWDELKDPLIVDWKRVRGLMEHENYLILERGKILLASQSLLSATFYFAHSSELLERSGVQPFVFIGVAMLGLLLAVYIAFGMYTAKVQHNKLLEWWFSRVGYKRNMASLPERMAEQPPICGRDPGSKQFRWSIPYCTIALFFAVLWISALVFAFNYEPSSKESVEFLGDTNVGEVPGALFRLKSTGEIILCSGVYEKKLNVSVDCSDIAFEIYKKKS